MKTIDEVLRDTIAASSIPVLQIEQQTGVQRASICRFIKGERTLRLDTAAVLADFFGLELRKRKEK